MEGEGRFLDERGEGPEDFGDGQAGGVERDDFVAEGDDARVEGHPLCGGDGCGAEGDDGGPTIVARGFAVCVDGEECGDGCCVGLDCFAPPARLLEIGVDQRELDGTRSGTIRPPGASWGRRLRRMGARGSRLSDRWRVSLMTT